MKKFFATVLALCMSLCIFAVPSSAEKHVRSDDGAVVVCNCQSKNKTRARKQSSLLRVIGESIKWAGIVVASAGGLGYICCLGAEALRYAFGNVRENNVIIISRRTYNRHNMHNMREAIKVFDRILSTVDNVQRAAAHEQNYSDD